MPVCAINMSTQKTSLTSSCYEDTTAVSTSYICIPPLRNTTAELMALLCFYVLLQFMLQKNHLSQQEKSCQDNNDFVTFHSMLDNSDWSLSLTLEWKSCTCFGLSRERLRKFVSCDRLISVRVNVKCLILLP